jgi:hypothetical protein
MNQPTDSTFIQFPIPSDPAPHDSGGQAPTAEGAYRTAHRAVATTAGGGPGGAEPAEDSPGAGAKRGRPSGCTDRVITMMKGLICRHGFSDTAAAEGVGVSSTTISRWKKQDPELAAELLKARYDCRIYHLEMIEQAAAAENGRGWRASAWMLERLFPGDYSPKMAERFAYMNLEDRLRDREASELVYDDVKIRLAKEKAERARAAAEASAAESHEAPGGEGADRSGADDLGGEPPPLQGDATSPDAEVSCIYSEGDSRNSRNSDEAKPGSVESGSTGRGRPGSFNESATAAGSWIYPEGASQNSRNCSMPTHAAPPGNDGALSPSPSPLPQAQDLRLLRQAQDLRL